MLTTEFGDPRLPTAFWDRVTVDQDGCWIWVAHVDRKGYGKFACNGAHREAYRALVSAEIDGLDIDHLCRVRACVNPVHLEAVSHAENIRRGRSGAPQAERTHCPRGHEYSGDNLYIGKKAKGQTNRQCRACKAEWARTHVRNRRPVHAS